MTAIIYISTTMEKKIRGRISLTNHHKDSYTKKTKSMEIIIAAALTPVAYLNSVVAVIGDI